MRGRDRDSQKEIQSLAGTNIHSIGHHMKHLRLSRKPLLRYNQGTNIHLQRSLWDFHSENWAHDEVPKVRDPELKLQVEQTHKSPSCRQACAGGWELGAHWGRRAHRGRLDTRSCVDSGSADVYEAPTLYQAGQDTEDSGEKVRPVLKKLFVEGGWPVT